MGWATRGGGGKGGQHLHPAANAVAVDQSGDAPHQTGSADLDIVAHLNRPTGRIIRSETTVEIDRRFQKLDRTKVSGGNVSPSAKKVVGLLNKLEDGDIIARVVNEADPIRPSAAQRLGAGDSQGLLDHGRTARGVGAVERGQKGDGDSRQRNDDGDDHQNFDQSEGRPACCRSSGRIMAVPQT